MPKSRAKAAVPAKAPAATPAIDNRRARFEYEFLERMEAGIVLTGTEIKSIRTGKISIAEAYARIRDGELWLLSMHVPPYKEGSFSNVEPNRPRKLLLHRKDIDRLAGRISEKGLTLVPTRLYFKRGRAKVEIALARGKKLWDKRREERERDVRRDIARALAER
ncbi:MAG: SsrA-binding protein SmpB [Candidatus Eremiobacteraeota bacterium]|nr:SsrA-binding protein SmpB [Candidatus Eremiobacteraeota bacterium]MBC5803963.1 SsrA-binding protein SmpB [Candidatus Eremiobacteraeota bacterium]MBC5822522.1 SsrA-binding protein SmpB [Candidatus Eremiobacteraeota bacterium]